MEQQSCQQQHSQHLQSFPALFLPARDPPFLSPFLESSSDGGWSVIRATSFFSPPDSFMCCMDTIHMAFSTQYLWPSVSNTCQDITHMADRIQHMWLSGQSTHDCHNTFQMIVRIQDISAVKTQHTWLSGNNVHVCQDTEYFMAVRTQ